MTNLYPTSGPVRGLLMQIRAGRTYQTGRQLCHPDGRLWGSQHPGFCCWCKQPSRPHRIWHDLCRKAHSAGMGKTVEQNTNDSLIQRNNACFQCGKIGFFELDHRTALSVAREYQRMGHRGWWKAWTLSNLRWLCHSCHATKTGRDRKLLARLRIESDAPMFAAVEVQA